MQAPDPIETILARLMPPALSEDGQREIDAMLDELAGPVAPEISPAARRPGLPRWQMVAGIAAAMGLLAVLPWKNDSPEFPEVAKAEASTGFVLVSGSDRIESMTDEGWQEDADGSAMHTLRLSAVEENNVRDEESGMVVKISEPREEILFSPISAF